MAKLTEAASGGENQEYTRDVRNSHESRYSLSVQPESPAFDDSSKWQSYNSSAMACMSTRPSS